MSKDLALVSIIIPIYNVEKYLEDCLESVIKQTYEKVEVILVDDGSTDKSSAIIDKYSERYPRFKIIHKTNGGLSDARNAGMKIATGKYVMFLDSDDYVADYFVETAVKGLVINDADILCFRFTAVNDNGDILGISSRKAGPSTVIYSNTDAIVDNFTIGGSVKVNAWNKIYKRSLFTDNNILYPLGKIHEDNLTTYKLLYFAEKIVFIDESLLYYRQRPGSIMKAKLTHRGIIDRYDMVIDTVDWLREKLSPHDLFRIRKCYSRTLLTVMISEAVKKKQISKIPVVVSEFMKIKGKL